MQKCKTLELNYQMSQSIHSWYIVLGVDAITVFANFFLWTFQLFSTKTKSTLYICWKKLNKIENKCNENINKILIGKQKKA